VAQDGLSAVMAGAHRNALLVKRDTYVLSANVVENEREQQSPLDPTPSVVRLAKKEPKQEYSGPIRTGALVEPEVFPVNITVGISSDSTGEEVDSSTLCPFARSFGLARKNSFASFSSVAGSGKGIAPNG